MPVSAAFLDGFSGRISSEDVPRLAEKNYAGNYAEYARDTRLLETWLKQRGLTAEQIKSKSWAEWSSLKTTY